MTSPQDLTAAGTGASQAEASEADAPNNAALTRGSIRGHLIGQTAPMIIGVAALMSVGLIDAYFIGQLGAEQLAAIAFIFPITVALSSLGVGVMVGINSVIARALGVGDDQRAARRGNFGIVFAITLGAVLALALFALLDPMFTLMQAPAELLPYIRAYMLPYAFGFPLLLTIMGINGTLRGQGAAKRTLVVSLAYSMTNWVLDPLLITGAFGFAGFGIAGAAYASLGGWIVGIVVGFFVLSQTAIPFKPQLIAQTDWMESARSIAKVAGPASFSNAINPIGLSVLTALVASEGTAAVAGFGAAGRLQSFAVVPLLALSGSIGAIVGQNWGAGQYARARLAMLEAAGFCLVYGLVLAVTLYFAGDWFAQLFSDDSAVVAEFTSYLAIAAWGFAGFGLLIVANGALNAVDRAGVALTQSFARVFLVMLPFAWFLRGSWGSEAIYAAELAANVLGGTLASLLVWRVLRSRGRRDDSPGSAAPASARS
ncbi:putative multidrug resistance protein NorM [Alteripontixanthobacter maritimus]|uniref:Putative multidrug resistance protein NorM n=1 Tax=Alteripontixanthobacter maritimus TaxID=2161824 RepID=A0A369Q404_9SPHN|nr:MATE family efflux transporter [Alteripontixanthobacter maritimus]RDC59180.1 putative multidrug resistance protein NorM [Alteripontixanthobacter maritimus]